MDEIGLTAAFYFGALVATFLVSRLLYLPMNGWSNSYLKFVFNHFTVLMIIGNIGGWGMANGGPFAGFTAIVTYSPVVIALCLWDCFAHYQEAKDA